MATKNIETATGLVEQINANRTGIKVGGQWLNISQYRPIPELPTPGQRVLDGGQVHQLPMQQRRGGGGGGGRSPAELREIRRPTCLKAAAEFGASRPEAKSSDVLAIAERFLSWVELPEGHQS
jgi:hypothetical protein